MNGIRRQKCNNGMSDTEEKYPFLTKVFDSSEEGYEKFFVKVFKINFSKYHEFYP